MANRTYTIPGRGNVSQQEYESYWNGVFASDPVLQQLAQQAKSIKATDLLYGKPNAQAHKQAFEQRLAQLGFVGSSTDHDMHSTLKNGQYVATRGSFVDRNAKEIGAAVVGAAIGGPFAAAALAGGGAGAGAGAGSATASSTTAGAGAGTTAATTGASTGGGWAAKLFGEGTTTGDLIRAGVGTGLSYLSQRQQQQRDDEAIEKARQEQQRATDEANARLDRQGRLRGEIYNQQRGDFNTLAMPGFSTLSELLGLGRPQPIGPVTFQNALPTTPSGVISGPPSGTMPTPGTGGSNFNPRVGQPGVGLQQPRSLSEFSGVAPMVTMIAPTGEHGQVPADQVGHYEGLGARRA